ncbi:hypothetical protein IAT38_002004 [Cryptococcus sp. DSM 104549]
MSILSPGTRCTSCPLVDFLPFTCPSCQQAFCRSHIQTHGCTDDAGPSVALGKLDRGKKRCEVEGCERESIESVAGVNGRQGEEGGDGIAREVRCSGCGGAYCTRHRAQTSHSCTAPLEHNARHDAFLARRAKAREIIAQHFPEQADRVVPKPPPPKDVVRKRPPSPERLPPSLQPQPVAAATDGAGAKKTKTKAEKLWDLHLRKVRSSATRLGIGSTVLDEERRFFEWGVDLDGVKVKGWQEKGKWEGKLERAWVGLEMPVGKLLDLIIAQAKVARPKSDDSSQALSILCLHSPPDSTPSVTPLELPLSAGKAIPEGAAVVLIRGGRV